MIIHFFGGTHHVDSIEVEIPEEKIKEALKKRDDGRISIEDWAMIMTDEQNRKVHKHFCGMKDCMCGGFDSRYEPVSAYTIEENGEKHYYL